MKHQAYKFAQEVDEQIDQLSDKDYHLRLGRSKVLQEELLPISRLGVYFKLPGLEVEVEAFENSGLADGHISISGFRSNEFDIQVTYIYSYEESLRRELLVSKGAAPTNGQIFREKRSGAIISSTIAEDFEEYINRLAENVINRFKQKKLIEYKSNTILLIAFDEFKLYGNKSWNNLISIIEKKEDLSNSKFEQVYLLNCAHNDILRIA